MPKNKTLLVIGVFILLLVIVFGLKYSGSGSMSSTQSTTPSNLAVPANTVVIQSNSFNPGTLTAKVGQKITWTNNDSYTHTVTSDNGAFDSGSLGSGQSFSFTFTKAGTYSYHCAVHPFMTAKIIVN